MKKLLSLLLALLLMLSLAACGKGKDNNEDDGGFLNREGKTTQGDNPSQGGKDGTAQEDPQSDEPKIYTDGEVGMPAPAYVLPENVQIVVRDDESFISDYTVTKLGDDYMLISEREETSYIDVIYFKAAGSVWERYRMTFGGLDEASQGVWFEEGYDHEWEDVEEALVEHFILIYQRVNLVPSDFSSTGEYYRTSDHVTVRAYTAAWDTEAVTCWISDEGFVFKTSLVTAVVTKWDTSVKTFAYDTANLPAKETETEKPTVPDDAPMTWTRAEVAEDSVKLFARLTYGVPEPAAYTVQRISASTGLAIVFESDADLQAWKQALTDAGFSQGSVMSSATHMVIFTGKTATIALN